MADDPEAGAPKRLRPTIITAPAKRAKVAPPAVRGPTAIPGVTRQRIAVASADLARLCPGAEPRVIARALRLIDGFVIEDARAPHVDPWGREAEQEAPVLVEDALGLARTDLAPRVRGHVDRVAALLGTIDITAPRDFAAARALLDQLIHLTRNALAPLQDLRDALDDHARRIDEAGLEIEAAALAALFLSERLPGDLGRRFLQREISLSKTALAIRASQFERDSHAREPRVLIAAIKDVLLAVLPGWLDDAASLARPRRRSNPTEMAELQNRLRAIVRHLPA